MRIFTKEQLENWRVLLYHARVRPWRHLKYYVNFYILRLPFYVRFRLPLILYLLNKVPTERKLLREARAKYQRLYEVEDSPLISVAIATYNRAQLLAEKTIPSVLAQTYQKFEIVIFGDGCTDDTEARIQHIGDPRIRFENLTERSIYPQDPQLRWMVAGIPPMQHAYNAAKGDWIAHLDDDDIFQPDHLEKMLRIAYEQKSELVYSRQKIELSPSKWTVGGAKHFGLLPVVPHSTVFMRTYIRLFTQSFDTLRFRMAADWHLALRMRLAGVRHTFLPEVTVLAPLRPNTSRASFTAEDYV